MRLLWVGLILTAFLSTCQEKKEDKGEIIVSVYGKNLYKTDLENIFYEGISYNDSVLRSKVYIDKWIRNQLLVRQAENNLSPEQLDFSYKIEEYRNSLVINKYETELINQNLDTEITDDQIYEYYTNNSDEFRLNRDIVKIAAVTLPNDCKNKWIFTKLQPILVSFLVLWHAVVSATPHTGENHVLSISVVGFVTNNFITVLFISRFLFLSLLHPCQGTLL